MFLILWTFSRNQIKRKMELTLDIREEKVNFFLELLQQFEFVSVKNQTNTKESPYNAEFVAKIKSSQEDIREGRFKKIKTADLWK